MSFEDAQWALWQGMLSVVGGPRVEDWNDALMERWRTEKPPWSCRRPIEVSNFSSMSLERPLIVREFLDKPWDWAWLETQDLAIEFFSDATLKPPLGLVPDKTGTLAEILPLVRTGNAKIATEMVIRRHPELLRELPLAELDKTFGAYFNPRLLGLTLTAPLFVGRRGRTDLHAEPIANVALQMQGTKRWSLIDPRCWRSLKPRISPNGRAYLASGLDPDDDLTHHQCLDHVDLGPRDLLFLPPFWWHRVDYVDDDDVAIGVSLFHLRFKALVLDPRNLFFFLVLGPNILKELVGWKTQ